MNKTFFPTERFKRKPRKRSNQLRKKMQQLIKTVKTQTVNLKLLYFLMSNKNERNDGAEDMGQFLYHLTTRKIIRRLQKLQNK